MDTIDIIEAFKLNQEVEMIQYFPDHFRHPKLRISIIRQDDTYLFGVQRAFYPEDPTPEQRSNPLFGEKFNVQRFAALDELKAYLQAHGIALDCWLPVDQVRGE